MDRDLLITAAILHDLGKLEEYEIKGGDFAYCERASYLGHITLCEQAVSKLIDLVPDFPPECANELRHMILAHHGKKEWGSHIEPRFIEAEALSLADLSDSQLNKFSINTEGFTDKNGGYHQKLERFIIRGNKTK